MAKQKTTPVYSQILQASRNLANQRTEQTKQKLRKYRQDEKEKNIYAQGKAAGAAQKKRGK